MTTTKQVLNLFVTLSDLLPEKSFGDLLNGVYEGVSMSNEQYASDITELIKGLRATKEEVYKIPVSEVNHSAINKFYHRSRETIVRAYGLGNLVGLAIDSSVGTYDPDGDVTEYFLILEKDQQNNMNVVFASKSYTNNSCSEDLQNKMRELVRKRTD